MCVAEIPKAIKDRNVFSECSGDLQIFISFLCFPGWQCLLGLLLTCVVLTSHLGPIFSSLPQDVGETPDWQPMTWLVPNKLPSNVLWHRNAEMADTECVSPLHLPQPGADITNQSWQSCLLHPDSASAILTAQHVQQPSWTDQAWHIKLKLFAIPVPSLINKSVKEFPKQYNF